MKVAIDVTTWSIQMAPRIVAEWMTSPDDRYPSLWLYGTARVWSEQQEKQNLKCVVLIYRARWEMPEKDGDFGTALLYENEDKDTVLDVNLTLPVAFWDELLVRSRQPPAMAKIWFETEGSVEGAYTRQPIQEPTIKLNSN